MTCLGSPRLSRWARVATHCALFTGLAANVASAASDDEPRGTEKRHEAAPDKREVPDYDGRAPAPATPGEVLLWVPRVALFPAYVVSEYVIRRPLGYLVTEAERAQLPTALYNLFTFGPDHKAGVVPTVLIDFDFEPSVGFYAFWDDAGFANHDLRLRGATWGGDWLAGAITERFHIEEALDVTFTLSGVHRPDYVFYGLGPSSRERNLSRYGADVIEAREITSYRFGGASSIVASLGYRSAFFRPGEYDDDEPTLDASVQAGRFPLPPGYEYGYRAGFSRVEVGLDTRTDEGRHSGGRVQFELEQGSDFKTTPASGWLRYGGTVGGFLDLGSNGRIVSLSASALFSDPLGSRPVPFTELAILGGNRLMPGFASGRLVGESAAVTTLRYSWPIWIWLNGSLQAALGNVFGEHLSGFSLARSRLSMALGIESNSSRDNVFQALFGLGSEPLADGTEIESARVTLGVRNGF